ncbi:GerMN domain-containing protein [Coleofasciculus chthonoplastes]|uniref:GerMN domain-containing protein n=1 Tax=Coleofasciculus chthonoplastes TaxID=64178 RepID=UPI0032F0F7B5
MSKLNLKQQSMLMSAVLALSFTTASAGEAHITSVTTSENSEATSQHQPQMISQNSDYLRQIQVFLPKPSANNQTIGYVEPVTRATSRVDVAEFAIEQIIQGPTSAEKEQGFTDIVDFRGESTCGKNFTINISNGIAQLQFCRTVPTAGIGEDAGIQKAVTNTLKQFNSVDQVVIFNKNGDCFKDMSGKNACLNSIEGVVWRPVPGTTASSGGELGRVNPQPWEVGINTISRNGDAINFDVNANGKYVRYSGNCQRELLSRIKVGDVENGQVTDTISVNENYFKANRFQEPVLDYACSPS